MNTMIKTVKIKRYTKLTLGNLIKGKKLRDFARVTRQKQIATNKLLERALNNY